MDKQAVIETIQGYRHNSARLAEIQEQLDSICYKTTATYGNLAATSGNGNDSKVERMGNRRHELKALAQSYVKKLVKVRRMIERSGLDETEKGVMWWIARNGNLQAYARRERIGKDNVYKIRDRAVKKIIAALETRNEAKDYKKLHYNTKRGIIQRCSK